MSSNEKKTSVHGQAIGLCAGGTGGHLFPALALCDGLIAKGAKVHLFTDERAVAFSDDFKGEHMHIVPSSTVKGRNPIAIMTALRTMGKGVATSRSLIRQSYIKAMIGFGGYPTVPPLLAARSMGVPNAIHEANAVMGRANRMLAGGARSIALSFDHTKYVKPSWEKKTLVTGNPVRQNVVEAARNVIAPFTKGGAFHLLIFGGSQGARVFSDIVPWALENLPVEKRNRLHVVQQCRPEDLDRVRAAYAAANIQARCESFFTDLPTQMAQSHFVIARSGASTVSELALLGRPSMLVPLPHSLDNDQKYNAQHLEEHGAAWMVDQEDFNEQIVCDLIERLFDSPEQLVSAGESAKNRRQMDSVDQLVGLVEGLVPLPKRAKRA